MPEAVDVLKRIGPFSPYFRVSTGPVCDGWRSTADLCDREIRDGLVADLASRMDTQEPRVAASTLFFGYAARLWSVAIGAVAVSGRCVTLERLLWRHDGGLHLHIVDPEFGTDPAGEVLDGQIEPLIDAWRDVVAPGLMWGNTASSLIGAGRVVGDDAKPHIDALFTDPRLSHTYDPRTGRRRSCCLYYRTPTGGVCGDCLFPTSPRTHTKETP